MPIGFTNLAGVSFQNLSILYTLHRNDHSLVERTPTPREKLRQRHTLRPMHKREHLRDVHVRQRMHDRIKHIVNEYHANDCARGLRVLRHGVICARAGPAGEDGGHADESDHVLRATIQLLCEESACHAGGEVPTG